MAFVVKDRVMETSATTGTGTLTLAGAVAGYQAFSAIGDGNSTFYVIEEVDGSGVPDGDWEVGVGAYTASGTTLSRDTVLASSNSGNLVNFDGTERVFCGLPASLMTFTGNTAVTVPTTGTLAVEGHVHDASVVTYTPTTVADWDGAADPGDVDNALDQLAERVTDVEGVSAATGLAIAMPNGTLVASVASNALTIAVKTLAGADPSAGDPVKICFRNATTATGDYVERTLSAALSLVISSGSTLGTTNSTPFRFWVVAFDDAGTVRLGVINANNGSSIKSVRDDMLTSSTAEGGAGAADSAHVFYTGSAVTTKALRILGYLEYSSGLATAGTYASAPTKLQLFGPGVTLPGERVQKWWSTYTASTALSTAIPADDTIPQNTEGTEVLTQAITPICASNTIRVRFFCWGSTNGLASMLTALFKDSGANAICAMMQTAAAAAYLMPMALEYEEAAASTTARTYKIRCGAGAGSTFYINGYSGGRLMGGVGIASLLVEEIAG